MRWLIAILFLLFYVAGALWYSGVIAFNRPGSSPAIPGKGYEKAVIVKINNEEVEPNHENPGLFEGFQDLTIRLLTGEKSGTSIEITNFLNYGSNFRLRQGDKIIVRTEISGSKSLKAYMYSIDREPALFSLALIFFILLGFIGGKRGVRSAMGIVFTFTSIVFIFIPMIHRGYSPVLAATLITILTVFVSLIILDGLKIKTVSAILGSVSGLTVSAIMTYIFQKITMVSGYTTSEADTLIAIASQTGMKAGELLFASVLIASLGAIMDIAISVSSAVCEVNTSNPYLNRCRLFRAGMNVGRDIMGTMANTLILAFTGVSINMMILIYSLEHSYYQILNSSAVVMEIIEALAGSLAVVLTVPATAFIASMITALNSGDG
jgi:uncharacterized membrane protein